MIVSVFEEEDELVREAPLPVAISAIVRAIEERQDERDFEFHIEVLVRE